MPSRAQLEITVQYDIQSVFGTETISSDEESKDILVTLVFQENVEISI